MTSVPWIVFVVVLTMLSMSEAKPGEFDYMVDCAACQFGPIPTVAGYSCAVRCELEGEIIEYILIRVFHECIFNEFSQK